MEQEKVKSKAPLIVAGVLAIACTTALTGFATYTVIQKANTDADKAYAATVYNYQHQLEASAESDETSSGDSATNVTNDNGETVVTNYTSDDLIQIDGEWYVLSDLLDDASNDGNGIPITVDVDNTVSVGENQYAHIENQEDIDAANSSEVPFYGNEYVVVDIDGTMVYLVKKGDTLSKVSGLVGYSVQELAENNYIKNVNLIYEGQTIRIPASEEAIEYVKSHSSDSSDSENIVSEETTESVDSSSTDETSDNSVETNTTSTKTESITNTKN